MVISVSNHMQLMQMLSDIESESAVYIAYNSDILDFTDKSKSDAYRLIIMSKKAAYEVPIGNEWLLRLFLKASKSTLFSKDKKIICWNFKNLCWIISNTAKRLWI